MTHVTFRELADHYEGRTDADARARIEEHVAACTECASELAAIGGLLSLMREDRTPEPPMHVVTNAVRLFAPEPIAARVRAWLAGLEQVASSLIFDSLAQPAFAAARGTVTGRRLRFEAAGIELDLQLERPAGKIRLMGQLMETQAPARALAGARFIVLAGGAPVAEGTTDAIGEFTALVADHPKLSIVVAAGARAVTFTIPAGGKSGAPAAPDPSAPADPDGHDGE